MKTVARLIAEANEYCRNIGMDPEEMPALTKIVSDKDMATRLSSYEETLSVTRFFSGKIIELMKDIPLLISVSDQDGVVIDMLGDEGIKKAVSGFGIRPGVQFTIAGMGTNVVNLSLNHHWGSVEVVGESHYQHYLQQTACYGAAFKNTKTDEVLGSLVIMMSLVHHNPMITTLLATVVDSIERELMLRKQNRQLNILHQVMMDNNQYGVLTTDLAGNVLEFNIRAEILLDKKCHDIIGSHVQNLPEIEKYIMAVLQEKKRFDGVYITMGKSWDMPQSIYLFDAFPIYDDRSEIIGAFAQLRDVTEVYDIQKRFNYLENHDEQTGLPNRRFLIAKLVEFLEANSDNQLQFAVIHLDLDRFKIVNDTLGHSDGDLILKRIAMRLASILEGPDFIARVGGDEFVLIIPCEDQMAINRIGKRLLMIFNEPFTMKGYDFHITASIGISVFPQNGNTPNELLANADTAMFHAKKSGKNQFVIYSDELNPQSHDKILLEASLRKAIELDELVLYYQPKIDIKSGRIIGVEALVRWQHPVRGMIPPSEFIPIAEETGLIAQLDEWVLWAACEQNKKWQEIGIPSFSVAINLSSSQFASARLIDLVENVLCETGLKPEYVELEITETMTMDVEHAIPTLEKLNALGVQISIDDFGTGYSSMNYLTKFAINRLKIDRSFIWNIEKSVSDSNIVSTIIRMAHNLGLKVIAEGVEDHKQLQFLREHGCDEVQGFIYSKPVSAEEIEMQYQEIQQGINAINEKVDL